MKKVVILSVLILWLGGLVIWDVSKGFGVFLKNDYRIAIIGSDGLGLVSVSASRGMTNVLIIGSDVMVWVPRGYGWYRADRINDLLKQENKKDLARELMFFNFGFDSQKVIWTEKIGDWENWSKMTVNFGILPSIYLKWRMSEMFFDQEVNEGQLVDNLSLDEVLSRQFVSDVLIDEDVKVSVFNASGANLLANFIAGKLNWLGVSVLTVGDYPNELDECLIRYGQGVEKMKTFSIIEGIFDMCQVSTGQDLLGGEMELILGREWFEMINYESYVRSF